MQAHLHHHLHLYHHLHLHHHLQLSKPLLNLHALETIYTYSHIKPKPNPSQSYIAHANLYLIIIIPPYSLRSLRSLIHSPPLHPSINSFLFPLFTPHNQNSSSHSSSKNLRLKPNTHPPNNTAKTSFFLLSLPHTTHYTLYRPSHPPIPYKQCIHTKYQKPFIRY
ncbi:hypothetical protein H4I96_11315 [Botrytis cinerea]